MARDLHQRINQHFRGQKGHDEHHLELISVTRDLSFQTTPTVLEAKLLENREIKRIKPRFNRALMNLDAPQMIFSLNGLDVKDERAIIVQCGLPKEQLTLGPFVDHRLIGALKVGLSTMRGDYSQIHHAAWPNHSVADWRAATTAIKEVIEQLWRDDEEWGEYPDEVKCVTSTLSWVAWGREIQTRARGGYRRSRTQ